jgi:Ca2+-binding RTX toxin-like protein
MATINGGADNDLLNGTGADDVINGLGGNDELTGAGGNDKLDGGIGNDTLAGGIGTDTLLGGAGNDKLSGDADNDTLNGAAGNDTLDGGTGQDSMVGGTGNDIYVFDAVGDTVVEAANAGQDEIQTLIDGLSLAAFANVENLTLLGAAVTGTGNDLANVLVGSALDNKLIGGKGNDVLEGRGGFDTLTGGLGDDTYIIDDKFDIVEEVAGQGKDTILTFNDFKLAAGVAVEVITAAGPADNDIDGNELANIINGNDGKNELEGAGGNDTINGGGGNDRIFGDDDNDVLTGGAGDDGSDGGSGNDTLTGGDGNDGLDGGTGNDVMIGGKGDDNYFVDAAGDKITELANQGRDVVFSNIANFILGANLEVLILEDAGINGTGNALDNDLGGNSLANKLEGGAGNDRFDGDLGKDTLIGGTGNDTYFLTQAGNDVNEDQVIEVAGGGSDTIATDVDDVDLNAFSQVENLTLLGDEDIDGTGTDIANRITGNDGKNALTGGKGDDTLDGGLNGDVLKGGLGNDTYFVDSLTDTVFEAEGEGKDTVFTNLSYLIGANEEVEVLTLLGAGDFNLTGNKFANTINGNTGSNILIGGGASDALNGGDGDDSLDGEAGDDVMTGGKGDDDYTVDSIGDKVVEAANQGIDEVITALVSFTLGANLEQLTLLNGAINGTGNNLNNIITGNIDNNALNGGAGNDTLKGGGGADTVIGGIGNDVYFLDDANDTVTENLNAGIDEIRTKVDILSLVANVENLTLEGVAITGVGNDLSNLLVGNGFGNKLDGGKGNDTLDGGGGKDTLSGGLGNDVYIVDNVGDVVDEVTGGGKDTVKSSVNFTIGALQEIETLILIASSGASLDGVGNDLANIITFTGEGTGKLLGNGGNDSLTGGADDDSFEGGAGNDTIVGGDGGDTIIGDAGNDLMIGGKGDDEYRVDAAGDKITELANQGIDTVRSEISFTLGTNLENLVLDGAALNGTGNTLNNELNGNTLDNKLDGGAGNDLVDGGEGKDTVLGGAGNDELFGGFGDDTLSGGTGNDTLEGGNGADIMAGDAGQDVFRYVINNPGDLVTVAGDTINGFQTGQDKIDLADLLDQFAVDPADAFSDGFVLLTKAGANTLVQFDSDGAGVFGALPVTLATVANATVAQADIILA